MEVLKKLKEKGVTKWRIARKLNIAWHTVHMWDKGTFKPTPKHQEELESLLNETV